MINAIGFTPSATGTTPRAAGPMAAIGRGARAVIMLLALVVAPLNAAQEYYTFDAAMARAFAGGVTATAHKPQLSAEDKQAVVAAARTAGRIRANLGGIYLGLDDAGRLHGVAVVDHVIGRTDYITYCVVLEPQGTIRDLFVMTYREPIGGEIKRPAWTRHFHGKGPSDALRLNKDIPNIAGATMSCEAVTERARFVVQFYAQALRSPILKLHPAATPQPTSFAPRGQPIGGALLTARGGDDALFQAADAADAVLNRWRPDSAVAQYNSGKGPTPAPALLTTVHNLANHYHTHSDGAFNAALLPALTLWQQAAERNQA
ncbi:MAG: FMN-binding protein, partial [Planctomycetota bacterium]